MNIVIILMDWIIKNIQTIWAILSEYKTKIFILISFFIATITIIHCFYIVFKVIRNIKRKEIKET